MRSPHGDASASGRGTVQEHVVDLRSLAARRSMQGGSPPCARRSGDQEERVVPVREAHRAVIGERLAVLEIHAAVLRHDPAGGVQERLHAVAEVAAVLVARPWGETATGKSTRSGPSTDAAAAYSST